MKMKNSSGVSTKTTPNNNVFCFFEEFKSNCLLLETTGRVKGMDSDGNIIEKEVPLEEVEHLKKQANLFISEFENYLRKGLCSDSELDKRVANLKLDKYKNNEILDILGIKSPALRVRYSRLTKKVYRDIFEQETPPKGLVSLTDLRAINHALARLRLSSVRLILDDYVPHEISSKLRLSVKDIPYDKSDVSRTSYVNALYLVFTSTRAYYDAVLADISPEALAMVLDMLQATSYNKVNATFTELLNNVEEVALLDRGEFSDYLNRLVKEGI